ncbi:ABC transporter ATP-binding protein [Actinoallomurus rhizosphaericola]|uniref:ABC transporter ATP-binding protein n=1 Tax=Actinoallomurus rhizosphaericola TaxID=2952536 RepID=UPI00209016EA|nr:ABC transporter ATP-binding protein [Actinoallomurus rhizosphaericola]MCO5993194.1 ABC transporter ATP-binding protein/permease [Actinoallomurus rhizosphaericola]
MNDHSAAWRALLDYVRPHRLALLSGGVLSLLSGAVGLVLPLITRRLIDDLSHHRALTATLLFMTALVLVSAGIGALADYVLRRTAESVVLSARRRMVSRLLRLRVAAVDHAEPGDLISRITSDTTLLRMVTTASLIGSVTGGLTILATLFMMALLDPVLLGVTLAVLALVWSVIGVISPRIRHATHQAQRSVGLMSAALERTLGAFRTVKASGAEQAEGERIHAAAVHAWQNGLCAGKWEALAGNVAGLSTQIAFLTVLGVGGARVASGAIDVGTLIAVLLYVYYLLPAVQQLVKAVTGYQIGVGAVTRIREVEELPRESAGPSAGPRHGHGPNGLGRAGRNSSGGGSAGPAPAAVAFEGVHFRYRQDAPKVHHDVSFAIPALGMTAIVGPSGAGKTTIFSLLERFYEADSGRVLIDGIDVTAWPVARLRALIGYVEQDTPVLSGTLRENLLLGAPLAGNDALRDVLHATRLDDMIERLPLGLDTEVGPHGIELSGGQRQRVAIARALLRRPRLLLLDEVTSQLDAVNEAALRDTVAEAARTTTVLVVAHRLSTIAQADRIIVMDAGRIEAIGSHADLLATNSLYAELAATQYLDTARSSGA